MSGRVEDSTVDAKLFLEHDVMLPVSFPETGYPAKQI